ncbi:MAG: hypothetical protein VYA27_07560, partial [Verrucomicrobiota bacterium]|nr:hypothetical protein [Verrucomicrobiota bacterium]
RIYSDLDRIEKTTNYAGTLVSRPIQMGSFTQEDMELKFSLWQLDDKELLKKIWQELSPFVDSGGNIKDTVGLKVDDNLNTYSSKELQFMHTFEHGGKLQILRAADRVFYDAALKYIKERNFDQMEEEIADVMRQDKEEHGEAGFMQEVVDKVEDTARDQINFWAKNAKDLASVGINAALSAAMGFVMRKLTDPVNLTDRPMMEEVWANLDGESRTLLGRIRTLNRRARQLGEGGYFPLHCQGQNLMDQLADLSVVHADNAREVYRHIQNIMITAFPWHLEAGDAAVRGNGLRIDVTEAIVGHINHFFESNLPADALKWAGWSGVVGGIFGGSRFTDPDKPGVEPALDKRMRLERERLLAEEKRRQELRKKFNLPKPEQLQQLLTEIKQVEPGADKWTTKDLEDFIISVKEVGLGTI